MLDQWPALRRHGTSCSRSIVSCEYRKPKAFLSGEQRSQLPGDVPLHDGGMK